MSEFIMIDKRIKGMENFCDKNTVGGQMGNIKWNFRHHIDLHYDIKER